MKGTLTYIGICASWLTIPLCLFGGVTQEDVVHRMQRDFGFIENTFQAKYAPLDWKATSLNWDLAREIDKAQASIAAASSPTLIVYRQALKDFVESTKDYQVNVSFHCTESSMLPFTVAGAEGRYFITSLIYDPTNSSMQRLNIGDEILTFDGKPIQEVVAELRNAEGKHSNPETDERMAQVVLTKRSAAAGFVVPTGPIQVTIRSKFNNATLDLPFTWTYTAEKFHTPSMQALSRRSDFFDNYSVMDNRLMQHNTRLFFYEHFKTEQQQQEPQNDLLAFNSGGATELNTDLPKMIVNYNDIGGKESFLPPLGKVIWQSAATSSFNAYLFQTASGKIVGYIRIPSYEGSAAEVKEFAFLMSFFQNATSGLVIDQLNNPGGSFYYFYALASYLANKPLVTAKHHVRMTQEDFVQATQAIEKLNNVKTDADAQKNLGTDIQGYPVTANLANQIVLYNSFLMKQWQSGKIFTDAYPLFGVTSLNVPPISRYSKPIVVLINGLDFSCGDFFPALLQDNQRALLFGSRTAGAGGVIAQMKYSTPFGAAGIQYTASIAERLNTKPIENLGVTPDVAYTITADDLQNNYRGYVQALNSTLESYFQGR